MEPVQWIKPKYRPHPGDGDRDYYHKRNPHNNNHGRRYKRRKDGKKIKPARQRVLIILASGKHHWDWR